PSGAKTGDKIDVFVYLDNESRPIATTRRPHAVVGDFAFLKVKELNEHGAFFDWGIDKDIFVSYSEQSGEPEKGQEYLLFLFIDERSGRIAATQKWERFIDNDTSALQKGDEVE